MEHIKLSTSRDFRINANILAEQQEESSDDSGSDDDSRDEERGDNDESVNNEVIKKSFSITSKTPHKILIFPY